MTVFVIDAHYACHGAPFNDFARWGAEPIAAGETGGQASVISNHDARVSDQCLVLKFVRRSYAAIGRSCKYEY
jgi:hypothetical protein